MIFNYLYKKSIDINDKIRVVIPTVGEVLNDENSYYDLISPITAMPIDYMVMLDDMHIDFTEINEYDLFLMMFPFLQQQDTSLVFEGLNLELFQPEINEQNGLVILRDSVNQITIDRAIHGKIASVLRKINFIEKNTRRPGNGEAKSYMIERARIKLKRRAKQVEDSPLESLIVAMVNTPEYKYDYETSKGLTIYQFNTSVRQVLKKTDYNNLMHGVYSGTVDAKSLSQDSLNWLNYK